MVGFAERVPARAGVRCSGQRLRTAVPEPYWDEELRSSREIYLEVFRDLDRVGLMNSRFSALGEVGVFVVRKKGWREQNGY